MRVISGILKGRNIKGYNLKGTRPTMNRIKESLFAMIQEYLHEAVVLDLFAGSGSLGIEAISNGAKFAYFVDHDKKCFEIINDNLKNLNINNAYIINNNYKLALMDFKNNLLKFDLIFLDPPYQQTLINEVIDLIINNNLLNDNGLIICEHINDLNIINNNLKLFKYKKYGVKQVSIYRRC